MSETATHLLGQILSLPESERLLIADKVWESLSSEKKEAMALEVCDDEDFHRELERRLAAVSDGTAKLIDGEEVFREARMKLQERHRP